MTDREREQLEHIVKYMRHRGASWESDAYDKNGTRGTTLRGYIKNCSQDLQRMGGWIEEIIKNGSGS